MEEVKSRKALQSEETRRLLIDAGRRLFAERGYAATGTEEIVRNAGVTRGALYHHFRDKRDLFLSVFQSIEEEVATELAEQADATAAPLGLLHAGVDAFLDRCLDPAVRQIALVDAPAVVGWRTWREVVAKYTLAILHAGLDAAMEAEEIRRQPVEALAHLLLGALGEAAMVLALEDGGGRARDDIRESCHRLIDNLG